MTDTPPGPNLDMRPAAPPQQIENVYTPAQHGALMELIRDRGPWPMVTKGRFQNIEQIAASTTGRADPSVSMDQFVVAQFRGWLASHGTSYYTELDDIFFDPKLRGLARAQLRCEDVGHTLNATALVHEAYLRLADRRELRPRDRRHFFAIAAQSMRRVLVDHARARKRKKRGAGSVALSLEHAGAVWAEDASEELLALDSALDRLAEASPRAARVVEQRFFAGLSLQETAVALGVSLKTVQRDWLLARAWLQKEIDEVEETPEPSEE